ncbi:MAG: sulfotransferase family 2 domain-containing protein [Desulfovibrionaceae bacterium]|nr:sulfotransferase family 2 domain-containing protein [Desulfovibrionaceae bacterium]
MKTMPPYNETQPVFFLHIPRTGGTTLDAIFFQNIEPQKVIRVYSKSEYERHTLHSIDELAQIRFITGHLFLDSYDPPAIYKTRVNAFTFLRDPVERLVSEYIFYKTWPNQHLYSVLNERKISFAEYLTSREPIFIYRGKNFMTRALSGKSFKAESYPYAALAMAKRVLEKNFFSFGLLERFDESLLLLNRTVHLNSILYLKRNKLMANRKETISDDDRALAAELNRADASLYAFAEELFESRVRDAGCDFPMQVAAFREKNSLYRKVARQLGAEATQLSDGIQLSKDSIW